MEGPAASGHTQGVNLTLNDHNTGLEVTEDDQVSSVTIKGHNNQVAFHEGVNVPEIVAYGHNNFVFSQLTGNSNAAAGHNCDNFA